MGLRKTLRRLVSSEARQRDRDIASARRFLDASPDSRLLTYHDLPPGAVVLDIGGYKGDWAAGLLRDHADATMHIFEPVPAFVDHLNGRFSANRNVHIHGFGLGAEDDRIEIGLSEDATSAFRNTGQTQSVEIKGISGFIRDHGIDRVDLLAINAEGAEYALLEQMIAETLVPMTARFLIQFHRVVHDAEGRRAKIQTALARTHEPIFDFPFCWELWKARGTTGQET